MVQFLVMDSQRWYSRGESKIAIKDNNSYWKLGLHTEKTTREAIKYLGENGYRCRENASKAVALDAIGRYQRGLMSYEGLSVSELQLFCKARGLSSKAKTASRLARALEKADDNVTFHLLKLPAEVRNMIYELYFLSLPDVETCLQPPLTLASSQLRSEALPRFYECATFVWTTVRSIIGDDGPSRPSSSTSTRNLRCMLATNFSQIKNLKLQLQEHVCSPLTNHQDNRLTVRHTKHDVKGRAVDIKNCCHLRRVEYMLNHTVRTSLSGLGYHDDGFDLQARHVEALAAAATKAIKWE